MGFGRLLTAFAVIAGSAAFLAGEAQAQNCDLRTPGMKNDCMINTPDGARAFDVLIPPGSGPFPLVFDFHGLGGNENNQRLISEAQREARERNTVIAWLRGQNQRWQGPENGTCCLLGQPPRDDVGFVRAVFGMITSAVSINRNRVAAIGLSNGAAFSHRLGCEAADIFSVISPTAFSLTGPLDGANPIMGRCRPARPISVIHFHGTADRTAEFNGGTLRSLSARDSNVAWSRINQCSSTPTMRQPNPRTSCQRFSGCTDGNIVELCVVQDGPHVLYPSVPTPDIADIQFDFFDEVSRVRAGSLSPERPAPAPALVPENPIPLTLSPEQPVRTPLQPEAR